MQLGILDKIDGSSKHTLGIKEHRNIKTSILHFHPPWGVDIFHWMTNTTFIYALIRNICTTLSHIFTSAMGLSSLITNSILSTKIPIRPSSIAILCVHCTSMMIIIRILFVKYCY